jgi:hypothetical protein
MGIDRVAIPVVKDHQEEDDDDEYEVCHTPHRQNQKSDQVIISSQTIPHVIATTPFPSYIDTRVYRPEVKLLMMSTPTTMMMTTTMMDQ